MTGEELLQLAKAQGGCPLGTTCLSGPPKLPARFVSMAWAAFKQLAGWKWGRRGAPRQLSGDEDLRGQFLTQG